MNNEESNNNVICNQDDDPLTISQSNKDVKNKIGINDRTKLH